MRYRLRDETRSILAALKGILWYGFDHIYRHRNKICNRSWLNGCADGRRWASEKYESEIARLKEEAAYSREMRKYWRARALVAEGKLERKS